MDMKPAAASTSEQFQVDEVSPSYWRATFTNGPVNLLDPDTIEQLAALIDRIEAAPELTVVVFRSDNPITIRSGC
jgi:enoyl-CoA hydratase/carnithine racemase